MYIRMALLALVLVKSWIVYYPSWLEVDNQEFKEQSWLWPFLVLKAFWPLPPFGNTASPTRFPIYCRSQPKDHLKLRVQVFQTFSSHYSSTSINLCRVTGTFQNWLNQKNCFDTDRAFRCVARSFYRTWVFNGEKKGNRWVTYLDGNHWSPSSVQPYLCFLKFLETWNYVWK